MSNRKMKMHKHTKWLVVGLLAATVLKGEPKPDHIGITGSQWQIDIRDSALSQLDSTKYARAKRLPAEYGFPVFPRNSWKCNAFVAHRCTAVGATVPLINGRTILGVFYPRNPPWAVQWADPNVNIPGWQMLPLEGFLQPGWVASDGVHCGIVDYDGLAIAAGEFTVHRRPDHNLLKSGVRYRRYAP
jgi:hypothetical protein